MKSQQHLFDIPEDVTFFNIASFSPSFKSIEEAGINAVLKKSQPHTIKSDDLFDPVIELKQLFAKLIDASDYNRIATLPSVSYGMATIAKNVVLEPSDEVLIVDEQFPSNYYVWKKLTDKYGAKLKVVQQPAHNDNRGKKWNEDILEAITEHTALVTIGNVHWANGTIFDLKKIRRKTRDYNALLIVDGSQSVGAFPFSIKDIQPDALICAGYKWLFGPYGCAYGYFGPYFDHGQPLEENWANRLYSENLSGLTEYQEQYKPLAARYNVGESGSFIYVQMQIAALDQLIEWTPTAIQNYCRKITEDFVVKARQLGCQIEREKYRSHHMFGVRLPSQIDKEFLKKKFEEHHVYISFRGEFLRVSCHACNTKKDFDKLLHCLEMSSNL